MTLSDVQCLCELGKKLVEKGVASTVIKSVADYYKSFGFMVTMDFNNINYVIVASGKSGENKGTFPLFKKETTENYKNISKST